MTAELKEVAARSRWFRGLSGNMFRALAISIAFAIPTTSAAAIAGSSEQRAETPPNKQVEAFLATLKAGKGKDGIQNLMASSPLWSKHPGYSEQMAGQVDAAVQAYGPVTAFERLSSVSLGTMVVREYYLVQHRDMVTRWEFDLVRTGSGWNIGYFGFTDQPNAWFS